MTADVAAVASLLMLLLMALLAFTSSCLHGIPKGHWEAWCEHGCRPPIIDPGYWNGTEWRCSDCGARWRIRVDCKKSRNDYRQWAHA